MPSTRKCVLEVQVAILYRLDVQHYNILEKEFEKEFWLGFGKKEKLI